MCDCHPSRLSRRRLLRGLAAGLGATAFAGAARATPLGCFDAAALAGRPGERLEHRTTAADAFVMPTAAEPGAPVTGGVAGIIRRVTLPEGDKAVALTFDLCQTRSPIAGYDGAIVDTLRANAVPATFFPAGRWLETHSVRAVQLAANPLFVLGNHSFDHPDLHSAPAERIATKSPGNTCGISRSRARKSPLSHTGPTTSTRIFSKPRSSTGMIS